MQIIEIAALSNGAHRNQTINDVVVPPSGWAVIPSHVALPSTYPFVDLIVDESGDIPIVTSMTPGVIPEVEPATTVEEPTPEEDKEAMLVDLNYRLTLLELGVN